MAGNTVYVQGSYVDVHDNEVVNLSIDKATVKLDENDSDSENISTDKADDGQRNEELFHFVHPELDEAEAWRIHDAVKRLVVNYRVPDICAYLKEQKQKNKLLLPPNPSPVYEELRRLGMSTGDGYSDKYFASCYKE